MPAPLENAARGAAPPLGLGPFYVKMDINRPDHDDPYFQFEISVVRKGCNGDKGWGWAGDNKILLLEGDNETYSSATIEFVTHHARLMAKVLNKRLGLK